MKRWKPRELRRRLSDLGCRQVRQRGSHEIWALPDGTSLPPFVGIHDNDEVHVQGLKRFLRDRGIAL